MIKLKGLCNQFGGSMPNQGDAMGDLCQTKEMPWKPRESQRNQRGLGSIKRGMDKYTSVCLYV
jgi:hypothetical protein